MSNARLKPTCLLSKETILSAVKIISTSTYLAEAGFSAGIIHTESICSVIIRRFFSRRFCAFALISSISAGVFSFHLLFSSVIIFLPFLFWVVAGLPV